MSVSISQQDNNFALVQVSSALNSQEASNFEKIIDTIVSSGIRSVCVDLSQSIFLSSEGIGSLLFASKRLSSLGGKFSIFGLNDEAKTLLNILGVYNSLNITNSVSSKCNVLGEDLSLPKNDTAKEINFTAFENPIIVECDNCNGFSRVHKAGDYICPICHSEFCVENDGTVIF